MKDREVKHFFRSETNMLNKGHLEQNKQAISSSVRIDKVLPPIEVISEYEAIYPGTLEKALAIAQKEQLYRHKISNKTLILSTCTRIIGQLFSMLSMLFICFTVVKLSLIGLARNAIYISVTYFFCMALVSIFGIYSEKYTRTQTHRSSRNKSRGETSSKKN